MALTTRRQFVQQTAVVAAALYGCPIRAPAGARRMFEAREQNAASLDATTIRKLVSQTSEHVITPETPDYESARLVFNRAFDRHPALIVRCAGAPDVARTLEFAQKNNLPLAVHGGGHNRAGFSVCEGGVVIDLSGMTRVEVDAGNRVARAEAGALVRNLDRATQPFGLATTLGGCLTVGIAGLTLGGGEGLLMSKYGAACDNLISAQLVTVDGKQVEASPSSNPDLFWAIRGGGGNFGVATALEYRLHPVTDVLTGRLCVSDWSVSAASCRGNTSTGARSIPRTLLAREIPYVRRKEDYVMTIDEVETLIKTKTRNKVRIHRLEERVGDFVAFLSYSIDDKNQMTIWHTEIPPSLQQMGIGGRLVEEAVQLASRDSSRLRIVCPFAKEHLARHPELKERYAVAAQALIADNESLSAGQTMAGV